MRLYLGGPMTWLPQFNFPAFERWTRELRDVGYMVTSPHEADPGHVQEIAWGSPDGDPSVLPPDDGPVETALRNVEGIGACDGLALIPNWHKSSGTIHEIATATRFRIPIAPVEMWVALGCDQARGVLS